MAQLIIHPHTAADQKPPFSLSSSLSLPLSLFLSLSLSLSHSLSFWNTPDRKSLEKKEEKKGGIQ